TLSWRSRPGCAPKRSCFQTESRNARTRVVRKNSHIARHPRNDWPLLVRPGNDRDHARPRRKLQHPTDPTNQLSPASVRNVRGRDETGATPYSSPASESRHDKIVWSHPRSQMFAQWLPFFGFHSLTVSRSSIAIEEMSILSVLRVRKLRGSPTINRTLVGRGKRRPFGQARNDPSTK